MSSKPKTIVLHCATLVGIQARLISIEVDLFQGLPQFLIVGLTDTSVQESKERVRAAIKNSGFQFPDRRITVNMAPADLRKEGPMVDLSIAVGIILRTNADRPSRYLNDLMMIGELSLDGRVRPVKGMLAIAALARRNGIQTLLCSPENVSEASMVSDLHVIGVKTLSETASYLWKERDLPFATPTRLVQTIKPAAFDFSQIYGQHSAKRGLMIAAAGGHHLFMVGPPGAGKTIMAKAFVSLLPPMTQEEMIEVTTMYSVGGLLPPGAGFHTERPFRHPHHTASSAAIVGGGSSPSPGEISLAHRGVLFFDEFPEFQQQVLEALRQPLEDRTITVARAKEVVEYPANFLLLLAANPCPCGFAGDPDHECICTPAELHRYRKKCSGPFMDRMDLCIRVCRVDPKDLRLRSSQSSTVENAEVVQKGRDAQKNRFPSSDRLNAEMTNAEVEQYCQSDNKGMDYLEHAMKVMNLSGRVYFRILKVARTIADLEDTKCVQQRHIAEALQYRFSSDDR